MEKHSLKGVEGDDSNEVGLIDINDPVISGAETPAILDEALQKTLSNRRTHLASVLNFTAEALWKVLSPGQRIVFLREEAKRNMIIAIGIAALRHSS